MAVFTEVARAGSQILVHRHHRQSSNLETLSGDALLGRLLLLSFTGVLLLCLLAKADAIRGAALMRLWFPMCVYIYSYVHTHRFFTLAFMSM